MIPRLGLHTRLAGFVMTYRRPGWLAVGLPRIVRQTHPPERLLVVDNAADPETASVVDRLGPSPVEYVPMHANLGPAGAASYALAALVGGPWDWLYWGGDDGPPGGEDTFARLLGTAAVQAATQDQAPIGAVAVSGLRWDWKRGTAKRLDDGELGSPVDVDVIPGGGVLLLRREAVEKVGLPRAELFWGLEDVEYSLRLRAAGFRLVIDGEQLREQRVASQRVDYRPKRSLVPRIEIHRLARHYYTTRNYVYLMRHVFSRPDLARREIGRGVVRCAAAWLRGPRFGSAFTACQWSAVQDGMRSRMGFTRPLPVAPRHAAPTSA